MKARFVFVYLVRFLVMVIPGFVFILCFKLSDGFGWLGKKTDGVCQWLSDKLPDPGPDPFAAEKKAAQAAASREISAQHSKLHRNKVVKDETYTAHQRFDEEDWS